MFSAGMAYVALSRVRSVSGLYLSAFDPKSVVVQLTRLQSGEIILVSHGLKLRTNVKRMPGGAADDTIDEWLSCGRKRSNGPGMSPG